MPRPITPFLLPPLTLVAAMLAACAQTEPPVAAPVNPARIDASVLPAKPFAAFVLRSAELTAGAPMPKEFTGDGAGLTPPLEWSGAPAGTKAYALLMHHVDPEGKAFSYWLLYDIPAEVQSLPQGVKDIGVSGINSRHRRAGYAPPHSKGAGTKTYTFTVYALSENPRWAELSTPVNDAALLAAIKGKVLAAADLSVTYTRNPSAAPKPPRAPQGSHDAPAPTAAPRP